MANDEKLGTCSEPGHSIPGSPHYGLHAKSVECAFWREQEGYAAEQVRQANKLWQKESEEVEQRHIGRISKLQAEVAQLRQEAEAATNDLMRISKALNQPGTQLVPIADRAIKAIEELRQGRDASDKKIIAAINRMGSVTHGPVERIEDVPFAIYDLQDCYRDAARARNGEAGPLLKRQEAQHKAEMAKEREARERAEGALRECVEVIQQHWQCKPSDNCAECDIIRPIVERALALVKSSEGETK